MTPVADFGQEPDPIEWVTVPRDSEPCPRCGLTVYNGCIARGIYARFDTPFFTNLHAPYCLYNTINSVD